MRRSFFALPTALVLGVSMAIAPLSPAQANRGSRCENAVSLARGSIEQRYGADVEKVFKFDITSRRYRVVVDRNGRRRPAAYQFDLKFSPGTRNFMYSPVLMKSFAQDIANHCGDAAMVTFNTFSEIPWYTVFGVDQNLKMFQFRCNDDAASQQVIPWGIIPHCE